MRPVQFLDRVTRFWTPPAAGNPWFAEVMQRCSCGTRLAWGANAPAGARFPSRQGSRTKAWERRLGLGKETRFGRPRSTWRRRTAVSRATRQKGTAGGSGELAGGKRKRRDEISRHRRWTRVGGRANSGRGSVWRPSACSRGSDSRVGTPGREVRTVLGEHPRATFPAPARARKTTTESPAQAGAPVTRHNDDGRGPAAPGWPEQERFSCFLAMPNHVRDRAGGGGRPSRPSYPLVHVDGALPRGRRAGFERDGARVPCWWSTCKKRSAPVPCLAASTR
jgi:hypothetical protein